MERTRRRKYLQLRKVSSLAFLLSGNNLSNEYKMSNEFDKTTEAPRVIKNLKKDYTIDKSIAIDELKVAFKKASRELYPSEMVDVLEEFIENKELDEATLKYENFRIVSDTEGLISSTTTEVVGEPRPVETPRPAENVLVL